MIEILENLAEGFAIYDQEWRVLLLNERAVEISGKPKDQLMGRVLWEICPELIGSRVEQEFRRAIAQQVPSHFQEFFAPLNRWLEIHAIPSSRGLVVYFQDITEARLEQIQLAAELEAKQQLLEAVLQQMPAGVIVAEAPSGKLLLGNQQVEQIWRRPFLSASDIDQYQKYQGFHPDGRMYQPYEWPLARTVSTGEIIEEEEIEFLRGDGTRGTMLVSAAPIRDRQGNITAGVVTFYDISDRKQTEASLRESQALFTSFMQHMPGSAFIKDEQGHYIYVNATGAELVNLEPSEVIGKTDFELVPAVIAEQVREHDLQVLAGDQAVELLETFPQNQKNRYWISFKFPVVDRSGQRLLAGMAFDMTERQQLENALRTSEIRLRSLIDANIIGVVVSNQQQVVEANDLFLEMVGYSREDLAAGQIRWPEITAPEYAQLDRQGLEELATTGKCTPFEKEYCRKDGSRIPVLLGATLLDPSPLTWLSVVVDLSKRKRAEAALRQSEERFRVAQDLSLDAFTILRSIRNAEQQIIDFEWTYVNPKAAELLKRPVGSLIGKRFLELLSSNQSTLELFNRYVQLVETGIPYELELYYNTNIITGWFRNMAVKLDDGVAVSFSDITQRKQEEAERIELLERERIAKEQAEAANRIKDEFLAVLSHELRSPLNPILGWAKLLQSGKLDAATTQQALITIERNANLQTQLIEDLLDVSRILRGKLSLNQEAVDLAIVLTNALDTVQLTAAAKRIQLNTRIGSDLEPVLGDAGRLQQVLWNLLSNAVKFTPVGGRVEVRLSQIDHQMQVQVQDTGKGIQAEFLPFVFDYFRQADSSITRNFGGLGLGLAIVRNIVELHGGSVWAESPGEGQGATFTLHLPCLKTATRPSQPRQVAASDADLSGVRVLVVDDDADMSDFAAFVLQQAGAEVMVAASALEALTVLARSHPHVVLTDIGMPNTDGYMLLQQMRALPGEAIPAIALTAYASASDRQQALAAGFQQHLAKPVDPEKLIGAIAQVLNPSSRMG